MNYKETRAYIENTAKFGMNFGLQRTEKILELLGNPHKNLKLIHVAGTNGKGSTTAMLSNILIKNNYKVGMYTSPYLEEFEERIQINNKNISKEDLVKSVEEVREAVDNVIKLGFDHPTEFEIITCAMLVYFNNEKIDYGVIEVGLGGRLDSTNVISPILTIITSISLDHMNILGNSIEEIAKEKGGIIKNNVPLVLYPVCESCSRIIEVICKDKDSAIIKVNEMDGEFISVVDDGEKIFQKVKLNSGEKEFTLNLNLLGSHQILNAAVVLKAVVELNNLGAKIPYNSIISGFKTVVWKGRLEVIKRNPMVVIDGAHNIDGIKSLVKSVEMYFKYNKIHLILGVLSDKEVEKIIEAIVPICESVIAVTPHSDRAFLAEELKVNIKKYNRNVTSFDNYEEAYIEVKNRANNDDLVLISGSLYMIGDMRRCINKAY